MPYACLNLHCPSVQIDHEGSYAIVEDGPRFKVEPLSTGTGPATFPEFDEAEDWRGKRLVELKGASV